MSDLENDLVSQPSSQAPSPRRRREPEEDVPHQMARQESQSIAEWLSDLTTGASVQIRVLRIAPKVFKGRNVGGSLAVLNEKIEESDIRERWGGGKYQLQVKHLDAKGQWRYLTAKTVDIAGDPKITSDLFDVEDAATPLPSVSEDSGLVRQALSMTERAADTAQRRAEKLEQELRQQMGQSGMDPDMIRLITEPLREQAKVSQATAERLERRLSEQERELRQSMSQKPDTSIQDRILEKIVDDESSRIKSIQVAHDAELRQLRQSHLDDMKRVQDNAREDMKRMETQHNRELDTIKSSYEGRLDSQKVSYETRVDGLKETVSRLERETAGLKSENSELRARKDEPVENQLLKIVSLKQAFEQLSGGPDAEGSTFERVASMLMESPLAQSIANRVAAAPAAGPPQPQSQAPRARMIRRVSAQPGAPGGTGTPGAPVDSESAGSTASGSTASGSTASGVPALGAPTRSSITVSQKDVQQAITFAENALSNGNVSPEDFARTARGMLPREILQAIKIKGIDGFLTEVAQIPETSVLNTQNGRNWIRKVAKALVS